MKWQDLTLYFLTCFSVVKVNYSLPNIYLKKYLSYLDSGKAEVVIILTFYDRYFTKEFLKPAIRSKTKYTEIVEWWCHSLFLPKETCLKQRYEWNVLGQEHLPKMSLSFEIRQSFKYHKDFFLFKIYWEKFFSAEKYFLIRRILMHFWS